MYTSFQARNFRCFRDFTFEPLERINLIAGHNGVGKTALLEALWVTYGAHDPDISIRLSQFRGIKAFRSGQLMIDLFRNFDYNCEIELLAVMADGKRRKLEIVPGQQLSFTYPWEETAKTGYSIPKEGSTISESPQQEILFQFSENDSISAQSTVRTIGDRISFAKPLPTLKPSGIFLADKIPERAHTDAERLGQLEINKRKGSMLEFLTIIEPRLQDLTVISLSGTPMIYGDLGGDKLLPLSVMGGGIERLLSLALVFDVVPGGGVLVDEVENGLHHSVLDKIWEAVAKAARKFDVQVFATTHSEECIRAAFDGIRRSGSYDLLVHRLERKDGEVRVVTYDEETLEAALSAGFEVR